MKLPLIEVKMTYERCDEQGAHTKVTDTKLVEAETLTEAQKIVGEQVPEIDITHVKKFGVMEFVSQPVLSNEPIFFKARYRRVMLDEKNATEKVKTSSAVVIANDFHAACELFRTHWYYKEATLMSMAETGISEIIVKTDE